MPNDTATVIAYVGAFVGLVGGGVSLFNSWTAFKWKKAELANSYLKDFNNNAELVFAGRCLDWNGGRLVLPENMRAYNNDEKTIEHSRAVFEIALRPDLMLGEMSDDPRIQIYRTSVDSFLSWLGLVASALDRRLFSVADIEEVGYWVAKLQSERAVHGFIAAYGYKTNVDKLIRAFRRKRGAYQKWWFPQNFYKSPLGKGIAEQL